MTPPHQHAHHTDHAHDGNPWGDLLDLDADVLAGQLAALVEGLPVDGSPKHIVDLGAGTGSGAFALLARFPDTQVTAVDVSDDNLRRLRENAQARDLGERVRTVQADLDADWPDLGTPDLVWASASVHHLADPDAALRTIRRLLAPGGLLALVELTDFPRFLRADQPADRPGLEDRCHAAIAQTNTAHVPHLGSDWGARLAAAGFAVTEERDVAMTIAGDEHPSVRRYAHTTLHRIRQTVGDRLTPADLAALDRLLDADDPTGILHRDDLTVRTDRQVWAAVPRRP